MRGVMVDLETMGTRPGSAIVSIGAVLFNTVTMEFEKEFYTPVSLQSCLTHGLTVDPKTVLWWRTLSDEARAVLSQEGLHLLDALSEFGSLFLIEPDLKVWGNGSDFDNPLLQEAYHRMDMSVPWKFYNNRCYRTIKDLIPDMKLVRLGTHHNALDDAKSQAWHLMKVLQRILVV